MVPSKIFFILHCFTLALKILHPYFASRIHSFWLFGYLIKEFTLKEYLRSHRLRHTNDEVRGNFARRVLIEEADNVLYL